MADQDEIKKPESIEDRKADISSDSEDGEEILRQIEMEINLRIYTPRQVRNAPVAATTPADESNVGKKDDKGDENKSNSLPKKDEESAAPPVVGVGRGRGRGRARNPPPSTLESITLQAGPSSVPEPVTLPAGPSAAPEPATSTKEPSAAPEIAPWRRGSLLIEELMQAWAAAMGDFPTYDSSDQEDLPEEVGETSESAGEKEATETAVALPPSGLGRGRGRGCGRPFAPTPPSPRSPIADEDLAAPIAASLQFDADRKFTPPERHTQKSGKESESSSKNEETEVGALPKPGFGRGRGRGKEKPSSPTPRLSQSARESSPQPGPAQQPFGHSVPEASASPQPGSAQTAESQHVPGRHPFYDRGYEIEEPVVARFGRSELLETFTQHDRSFDGPMKVTASYMPIKEANAILRKAREEEKKNPPWLLIPVADENKPESEIEDADDEDIPNPYE